MSKIIPSRAHEKAKYVIFRIVMDIYLSPAVDVICRCYPRSPKKIGYRSLVNVLYICNDLNSNFKCIVIFRMRILTIVSF